MLYSFLRSVARLVFLSTSGRFDVRGRNLIPKGNYVLIAPHKTWLDPLVFAMAASPKEFGFLAKKELYQSHVLSFILHRTHGIAVDRKHPGPSIVIKPVRILEKTNLSIIIFPSGTRHSQKLKSGAALIAKLAKVPLEPAVYQGPLTFKDLLHRQKIHVAFGHPIKVDPHVKFNDQAQQKIEQRMQASFSQLRQSLQKK